MYRSKRPESKGLMDNVAGITASAMIVLFLFMLTVNVMNVFAGEQPSGPEVEIELLYNDIKEACENPDAQTSGTIDVSSDSSIGSSLTVCDQNNKYLCYDETRYGDGDLPGSCTGIRMDSCSGGITGVQNYSIRVGTSGGTATIECED